MFISEILDTRARPNIVAQTQRTKVYDITVGGNKVIFTLSLDSPGSWTFYFKGEDGSFDISGKGGEFKVFAAAKWIVDDLVKERAPNKIEFEAQKDVETDDPEKRVNLYRKFLKKHTPHRYRVTERETDAAVYFTLTRHR